MSMTQNDHNIHNSRTKCTIPYQRQNAEEAHFNAARGRAPRPTRAASLPPRLEPTSAPPEPCFPPFPWPFFLNHSRTASSVYPSWPVSTTRCKVPGRKRPGLIPKGGHAPSLLETASLTASESRAPLAANPSGREG